MSSQQQEPAEKEDRLAAFFDAREQPAARHSAFTPERVAEIVRRDRDASE